MSFIIYPQQNNQLAVVVPTGEASIEQLLATAIPEGISYKVVDTLDIDNDFFNAYEYTDNGPVVNFFKAKEIQIDKFRSARKPLLEKLDIEYIRADETGDTTKKVEIAVKKQELRDVTKTTFPDNLDVIKNTWPFILNN